MNKQSHLLIMLYKILNNEAPEYLKGHIEVNKNNTRSKNKLIIQKAKNNMQKNHQRPYC